MFAPLIEEAKASSIPLSEAIANGVDDSLSDYDHVRRAIAYISLNWRDHPSVDEIADHAGVSATHLHHVFRRWAGLTPKAFMQAITLDHARCMLRNSQSVLDTAYDVGLSGPGRLHDLFVTHEAMSPGEYGSGGEGLVIRYAFHGSVFGKALVMITDRGLCGLAFADAADEQATFSEITALADMKRRWPRATYIEDAGATAPFASRIFSMDQWASEQPLRVVLIGTDFEVRVWQTLLRIPLGGATTYSQVAECIGRPKAARAVGAAVGKNPISFVVPCHRVIGRSGALTGYHWGITRKQAMLGWEAGRAGLVS